MNNTVMIIGIVVVLALAGLFGYLTCKSKDRDIFKWILIVLFVAIVLTWLIPGGSFATDGTFTNYDKLTRVGISNIRDLFFYSIYYPAPNILLFLAIGGFYGVLAKVDSYKALVRKMGSLIKKAPITSSVVIMVLLIVLTSLISKSPYAMVVFLPFLISALLHAKFDKLTAVAMTFGSLLVGQLAGTYGTENVFYFNYYMGSGSSEPDVTIGLTYRLIIGGIAALLFILYNVYRIYKVVNNNKYDDVSEDAYEIEEKVAAKKDYAIWPAIIVMVLTLLFVVLAFFDWNGILKVELFNEVHRVIHEYVPFGEEHPIFSYLIGNSSNAFGKMEINSLVTYLIVMSGVAALIGRLKFGEYLNGVGNGIKSFLKPIGIFCLTYAVFLVIYTSPFTTSFTGMVYGWSKSYVPFIPLLDSLVTSIFHSTDIGYTSYTLMNVYTTVAANHLPITEAIYVTSNGLVQLFAPVSGLLLMGLAYLNVDYKKWFKYIWLYALVVLVVIALVATVAVYIIK